MLGRMAFLSIALAGEPLPAAAPQQYRTAQTVAPEPEDAFAAALSAMTASEGETRLAYALELAAALGRAQRNEAAAAQLGAEIERASRSGVGAHALAAARTRLAVLLLGLGQLAGARNAAVSAERELDREAEGSVDHVAAMLVLGRTLNASGELQSAGAVLDRAAGAAAAMPVLRAQINEVQGGRALLRGDGVSAIRLYGAAIDTLSQLLGSDNPRLAAPLTGLANAQQLAGDFERSEASFANAIRIVEAAYGLRSNRTSAVRIEHARLLTAMGRYERALAEASSAHATIDVGTPAGRALKGLAASASGFAYLGLGQPDKARPLFEEGIALTIAERGANSPDLPPGYIELARIALTASRPASVERYARLAETILARQAPDAPLMAEAVGLRAAALSAQGKHGEAVRAAGEAAAILTRRSQALMGATTPSNAALLEQVVRRGVFERLLDIRFAAEGARAMTGAEVFAAAQALHLGVTSLSISQLAARHAAGTGPLAALLTERRGLLEDWRAVEAELDEQRSGGRPDPNSVARLEATRQELASRAERLDARLKSGFPKFAALMRPQPVGAAAIRNKLRPGEAFLLQATTADVTHLWLVTRGARSPRYARTPFGSDALKVLARRLRDSITLGPGGAPPPFDAQAAHQLYLALLAPFAPVLRNTDALIVSTDRQVHALPLAMLVVGDPGEQREPSRLDFLVRHRIATAWSPSPASFVALRAVGATPPGLRPFFGAGAPVLIGKRDEQDEIVAQILRRTRAGVNPDDVRRLEPVPDAARQLNALAAAYHAGPGDVLTDQQATETAVKAAPLGTYRTLAFATHGLVAGSYAYLAEPGLVLTPPAVASQNDDGLLTASEISRLSLDADLVILSACNTASSDGSFAGEGLSGLARAFYYAGARSLLVSGWSVNSYAAMKLTTDFVRIRNAAPKVGKAEALRRAMLALVEGTWIFQHPAFWAPFMVAGEPD